MFKFKFNHAWSSWTRWFGLVNTRSQFLLPTKAEARLWFQCKIETFNPWWSSVTKSCGHCKESSLGKVRTKLGMVLPYHLGSWHRSILSGRFRWACSTASLEGKQSKEVFLLINISMINIFVCYIRSLYFLLFSSHKCLNLNSIMLEVFRPDDLG